jgi:cysteine desulfurase
MAIYLDNNATTRPVPEAIEAVLAALGDGFGNPMSAHAAGRAARRMVHSAREAVAALVGASPAEIVFTSGGTEAVGLAIRGALGAARSRGRRRIVASAVEHPATLATLAHLEAKGEAAATLLSVDREGRLDLDDLRRVLAKAHDVALVSILWANNETGVIFPIREIAEICFARGVPLHADAVQAAGRVPIELCALPIDFLSLSAHKLHGPKGAGALFVRNGAAIEPLFPGGPEEGGRRAGTANVPGIAGFGAAARLAAEALSSGAARRMERLRDRLEARILGAIPGAVRNGGGAARLPNTASLRIPGVDAAFLVEALSRRGVFAATGSACASGSLEPSHVLLAMGLGAAGARSSLRLSLSRETTEDEVERAAREVIECARLLRTLGAAPAARGEPEGKSEAKRNRGPLSPPDSPFAVPERTRA